MYNQKILTIFSNPKNAGGLQGSNGIGKIGEVEKGDVIKFYLKINDDCVIENARFKAFGSPLTIASASVATELVIGKTLDDATNLTSQDIIDVIGEVPVEKLYVLSLVEQVIKIAAVDYFQKIEKQLKNNN